MSAQPSRTPTPDDAVWEATDPILELSLPDALDRAIDTIRNGSYGTWQFSDWSRCTCGHLYAAARGLSLPEEPEYDEDGNPIDGEEQEYGPNSREEMIIHPVTTDGLYERMLHVVARANWPLVDALNMIPPGGIIGLEEQEDGSWDIDPEHVHGLVSTMTERLSSVRSIETDKAAVILLENAKGSVLAVNEADVYIARTAEEYARQQTERLQGLGGIDPFQEPMKDVAERWEKGNVPDSEDEK